MATAKPGSKPTKERRPTEIVTGVARLSYPHIWEPRKKNAKDYSADEGSAGKYGASLIFPKSDKDTLRKIQAAQKLAMQEGVSNGKYAGKKPGPNTKVPLSDGDKRESQDEAYVGSFYVNANSQRQPGIVDRNKQDITERGKVYAGCYVIAVLNFYPFNFEGKIGVGCSLEHIMKVKDGPELTQKQSAKEAFSDVDESDLPEDEDDAFDADSDFDADSAFD